jgi:hypothetical protein
MSSITILVLLLLMMPYKNIKLKKLLDSMNWWKYKIILKNKMKIQFLEFKWKLTDRGDLSNAK